MAPSLEQLKSNYTDLSSINEKQEKTVRYYESMTMKLVVAYIALQSLIFLSISRSNISCQHRWIPCCFSSLIAAIFGIPFHSFVTKWERTKYYYEMHLMELELIHNKMHLMELKLIHNKKKAMLFQGSWDQKENSNINTHDQDQSNPQILEPDVVKLYQRSACIYLVTLALVAYTIIVLISCQSILCH